MTWAPMPEDISELFKGFEEFCDGFDEVKVFLRVGLVGKGLDGIGRVREDVPCGSSRVDSVLDALGLLSWSY